MSKFKLIMTKISGGILFSAIATGIIRSIALQQWFFVFLNILILVLFKQYTAIKKELEVRNKFKEGMDIFKETLEDMKNEGDD